VEVYGTKGALLYNLEEEDTLQVKFGDEQQFRSVVIPDDCRVGQMQSFFDLLRGKGDGLDATIQDGFINQLTIDRIIQSFTEEKWVSITPVEAANHG
ncbi:gfo/Idh/MocA family oxidoreductase, partial [Paenibacillus sp. MCAF20]